MTTSTNDLQSVLGSLTGLAREQKLNDAAWAAAAGLRKETLSRLRRRETCDLATLQALAGAVGGRLGLVSAGPELTADGHFPAALDRDAEARLLALAASGRLQPEAWAAAGPRFFMAGLATMLASVRGADRRRLLELAEHLHPGASETTVFARWLARSPLRPSRFLPLLEKAGARAA